MTMPGVGVAEVVGAAERIRPYAMLTSDSARRWIDEVRPLVRPLLSASDHPRLDAVTARLASLEASPYGWTLGSWITEERTGPVIEMRADWSLPLAFLFVHAPRTLADQQTLARAVDSRLHMAVTNDVWQPFVKGPELGHYSMVRHHALMLAAAWTWLPCAARTVFAQVLLAVGCATRRRWRSQSTLSAPVTFLECAIRELWTDHLDLLRNPASFWEPHPLRTDMFETLADFALLANTSVLARVQELERIPESGWPDQLAAWAEAHREADFGCEELDRWWHT